MKNVSLVSGYLIISTTESLGLHKISIIYPWVVLFLETSTITTKQNRRLRKLLKVMF